MRKLCDLQLVDLVLEKYEANSLMDLISLCLNQTLKELVAINLTISHCPLQQIGMLSNLKVHILVIIVTLNTNWTSNSIGIENITSKYR